MNASAWIKAGSLPLFVLLGAVGLTSGAGSFKHSPKPVQAIKIDTADFYLFAQKQAELYRGELLTRSEMARLVQEAQRQLPRLSSTLQSLKETPYNLALNQQTLKTLKTCPQKTPVVILEAKLQSHLNRLNSVVDSYLD
jgi:hypothetical protein